MRKHLAILMSVLLAGSMMTVSARTGATKEGSSFDVYKELPFPMEKVKLPEFPDRQVSLEEFGAKNDGRTLNTEAFRKAIGHLVEKGGGTLLVPPGLWLTGPIELKSNICLQTSKGTVILFTTDFSQYPMVRTYYEGSEGWRNMSPLYACDATNIAVRGPGLFDGNGHAWRPVKKNNVSYFQWRDLLGIPGILNEDQTVWYPTQAAFEGSKSGIRSKDRTLEQSIAIKEYLRPVLLNFIRCKKILIEGSFFRNSPAWCLHPVLCEHLTVHGVSVENESWASNGDAIDVESCRNVRISDCVFDAGDDGICMKSGKDEEGRIRGVPTENVIITGCKVYKGHGGFVVGSEMSGGVRNIFLKNCQFIGTDNGLRFKSTRGRGGVVENIFIENIDMANIKSDAILYDLYYGGKRSGADSLVKASEATPIFRNICMKNVVCKGAGRAAIFQGLPEMKLQNIRLENAVIESENGVDLADAEKIVFKNVSVFIKGQKPLLFDQEQDIVHLKPDTR